MSNESESESRLSFEEKAKHVSAILLGFVGAMLFWTIIFWFAGVSYHFGDWAISSNIDEIFYANDWFVFGVKDLAVNFGDSWWGLRMHYFIVDIPIVQAILGGILQIGVVVIWFASIVRTLIGIFDY